MGRTTFVLGGARSGKSEVAEAVAAAAAGEGGPVTYVATGALADAGTDPDWEERIAAHRARRPSAWTTLEAGTDLPDLLRRISGVALVDSLGTWVAASPGFAVDVADLVSALAGRDAGTVVVSDEVGMGVHPETEVGLAFRDALGSVNRAVAAAADEAWLVVAGRRIRLEQP